MISYSKWGYKRSSYMSVSQHTSFNFIAFRLRLTAVVVVFARINRDAFVNANATHSTQWSPVHNIIKCMHTDTLYITDNLHTRCHWWLMIMTNSPGLLLLSHSCLIIQFARFHTASLLYCATDVLTCVRIKWWQWWWWWWQMCSFTANTAKHIKAIVLRLDHAVSTQATMTF